MLEEKPAQIIQWEI